MNSFFCFKFQVSGLWLSKTIVRLSEAEAPQSTSTSLSGTPNFSLDKT